MPLLQAPPWQLCPHSPQLVALVCKSWHPAVPHAVSPLGHWQDPLWHVVPPVHPAQLAPQWSSSLWVSQHPAAQAVKPPTQAYEQEPALHIGFASATVVEHGAHDDPQWFASFWMSQQPEAHAV